MQCLQGYPSYEQKPHKKTTKKIVTEKHYYGQYGKQEKPERALGGFEGDLHTPVFRPHGNGGYHGNNGQSRGQLRGYEAAYARQRYYQLAPHNNY